MSIEQEDRGADLCAEFKQFAQEIISKGLANGGDPNWTSLFIALSEAEQERNSQVDGGW